jgi:hypothetical protein
MEPEGSLLCSQEPSTCTYVEPDESTPHPHTQFPQNPVLQRILETFSKHFQQALSPIIHGSGLTSVYPAIETHRKLFKERNVRIKCVFENEIRHALTVGCQHHGAN